MGGQNQIRCWMVFTLSITAVAGYNDTTDSGHTTVHPPQSSSTILMTTLVGHDTPTNIPETTPQETSPPGETQPPHSPPEMTTQPPYSTNQPTTQSPYSTNQPTTQPPYSTNQPTTQPPYSTNQPTTQSPYSTNQPTTQPPYSTNQPTTQPPYSTNQPTTQPSYSTNQPTTQSPYSTNQPTTQPPYSTNQPTTQPPYSTNQPTTQPPYSTNQPTTQPPYSTTQPPYSTNQPTTQPPYSTNQPTTPPPYSTNQPTTQPPYSTNQPTTQSPYSTNQPTTQPPYSTKQPTTQPPFSTNQPTTQPPYSPTEYTTLTTQALSSTTTSAPCKNDTSQPEYGDEDPPTSNATTTGDEKCTDRGGVCSTETECEGGKYVTGLCSGQANRKCCIQDDPEPENFELVPREEWESTVDRDDLTFIKLPVTEVIIHHTEGQEGCTTERCKQLVRNIQAGHKKRKDKNGNFWVDIGYSFLICGDGKVYEGRGWDKQGAHTPGHNKIGIAIAFIGNFDEKLPTGAALNAARALIEYGLANGKISPDYEILGHRDATATTCPGDALYNLVKNSPKPKAPGN